MAVTSLVARSIRVQDSESAETATCKILLFSGCRGRRKERRRSGLEKITVGAAAGAAAEKAAERESAPNSGTRYATVADNRLTEVLSERREHMGATCFSQEPDTGGHDLGPTIAGLFRSAEQALRDIQAQVEESKRDPRADRTYAVFDLEFDGRYGYPRKMDADVMTEDRSWKTGVDGFVVFSDGIDKDEAMVLAKRLLLRKCIGQGSLYLDDQEPGKSGEADAWRIRLHDGFDKGNWRKDLDTKHVRYRKKTPVGYSYELPGSITDSYRHDYVVSIRKRDGAGDVRVAP